MNPCLSDADLHRYHADELDAASADRVRRHLAECPGCARRDAELLARHEVLLQQARNLVAQSDTATETPAAPGDLPSAAAAWTEAARAALFADARLAGYELLREIHRGGQGVVFQAIQKSTKRKVAVKVMRAGPLAGADDKARFEREVEILGQLQHPNIVAIHDSGTAAGYFYYVMDYISGRPLHEHFPADAPKASGGSRAADASTLQAPPTLEESLRLFVKICRAVHAAHLRGITHRDLKPGNILIDNDGEPHVLDFGMAKVTLGGVTDGLTPQPMTLTGQFLGSIPWASPEQAEGVPAKIDVRTDVYALGVILYQILTGGKFPYEVTGNMRDVLDRILQAEPVRPGQLNKRVETDLETIVLKCLNKERARRYGNAGELADDLEQYLADRPIKARPQSVTYLLKARGREWMRKHFLLAYVICVFAATLAAQLVGVPLFYEWTPLAQSYERRLAAYVTPRAAPRALEHVVVIAFSDRTAAALPDIAAREGLTDIAPQYRPSLRSLHGRLMEKLAAAGPRAVVWDWAFPPPENPSPLQPNFDADFLRGVRALRAKGIDVVVGTPDWEPNRDGLPIVSAVFRDEVRAGSMMADFSDQSPWKLELAVQRNPFDLRPSLALAAAHAFFRPGARPELRLDADAHRLYVRYTRDGVAAAPQNFVDALELSAVELERCDAPQGDLRADDLTAFYQLQMPDDESLRRATLDYAEVLTAETALLRARLEGKLALLGWTAGEEELRPHPSGRRIQACYGQAAGIDALLRKFVIRRAKNVETHAWALSGALLGLLAALAAGGLRRRWLLVLGLTVLLALASILAYWGMDYFYNPLIPILALVLTSETAAFVRRASAARRAVI